MDNPKLLPLSLLHASEEGAIEGITRFQKLAFLAQEETDYAKDDVYKFRPDDFGPFSPGLYDDIDNLVEEGYIRCLKERTQSGNKKQIYELTEKGENLLKLLEDFEQETEMKPDAISQLVRQHEDTPLLEFIKEVYEEYPEMAVNSQLDLS